MATQAVEGDTKLYPQERHARILELVATRGRVEVTTLAEELDVTTETIRRDLTKLVRQGLVRRVHGGAIHVERLGYEPTLSVRGERFAAEKERIGRAARDFLPDGGSVLLDAGTTTMALARLLPQDRALTVVTNSIPAAGLLAAMPKVDFYMLGGRVRSRTAAAVGRWASAALADLVVDVAFIGTNGLSVENGLTTPNLEEANTKAAMIAASRRVVLLTDHSKVGAVHFCKFGDLDQLDVIVTDAGLDDETAERLVQSGPDVLRV
jgi:DeoR family fructose operon transcriptional repressor